MTIQLPIIVWTVICFCLLILILKFLLFKPIFRIMDERNRVIESAKSKKITFEEETEKHRLDTELESKKREEQFLIYEKKQIDKALSDSREAIKTAIEEQAETAALSTEKLKSEKADMISELDRDTDKLAEAFIRVLTS